MKLFYIFIITLFFASCNKDAPNYTTNSFKVTLEKTPEGYNKLSWDKITSIDFNAYEIFRSDSIIEDPKNGTPLKFDERLGIIQDNEQTSFIDSLNFDKTFYRIRARLKLRDLYSNSVDNTNGVYFKDNIQEVFIDEKNKTLIGNMAGFISTYNYEKKEILASHIYAPSTNYNDMCVGNNEENKTSIYFIVNNNIEEVDAVTLVLKKTHIINISNIYQFDVRNGIAFLLTNDDSITTFNLANDSVMHRVNFSNNLSKFQVSENGNLILFTTFSSAGAVETYTLDNTYKPILKKSMIDNSLGLGSFARLNFDGSRIISGNRYLLDNNFTSLYRFPTDVISNTYKNVLFTKDNIYAIIVVGNKIEIYDIVQKKLVGSQKLLVLPSTFNFQCVLADKELITCTGFNDPVTFKQKTVISHIPLNF